MVTSPLNEYENKPRARPARALTVVGLILTVLGVFGLLGGAYLGFGAGFQLAPPVSFGTVMTVDVSRGDHAVYVTPNERWSDISCTGDLDGEEFGLRPSMIQQGLLLPERWDSQGSFGADTAGALRISCDGPVSDARFTVGPVVTFLDVVGAVAVGALGFVVLAGGLVLVILARRRARA
ncbi:hypothetical protein C5E11_08635 [Clavibacter michiganensis]|nr:hypothetical protein [Clavibacter michiganensis]PPF63122.1 hypothetical protein C5E11_08635 [Clavibacter michiganensis]